MSYKEKEQALIDRLKETDYEMFDGDKDEALDFIGSRLEAFPNYANIVIREQIMVPLWRARCDTPEFQSRVQSLDQQRHNAHEAAISSVNILNRLSGNLGLEPFAQVDTKDRQAVADMVGDYVIETYRAGTKAKGMDGATYQQRTEYDPKTPHQRIRNLNYGPDFTNGTATEMDLSL